MNVHDIAARMRALLAGDTVMPHEHVAWLISLIPALADVVEAASETGCLRIRDALVAQMKGATIPVGDDLQPCHACGPCRTYAALASLVEAAERRETT